MSSMQRPLPDNTHETNIHAPVEIRTRSPSKVAAVDHVLVRAATGISLCHRLF